MKPMIVRKGATDTQVCVPVNWTDEEVVSFANKENPCGTENGWQIRREGSAALAGDSERVPCEAAGEFTGYVHVMLDA